MPQTETTALPFAVSGMDLGANTVHNGNLYIFFGDSGPAFFKPIGVIRGINGAPVGLADLGREFLALEYGAPPKLADLGREFLPWEYRIRLTPDTAPISIGENQTPTGTFSYDQKCYVFAVYRLNVFPDDPARDYVSALTVSPDPELSESVFDHISGLDASRLSQVAPMVIRNNELPDLPESDTADGLIMLGQAGRWDGGGICLAWMPLRTGQTPNPNEIWYYTGDVPSRFSALADRSGARTLAQWSPFSTNAKELVHLQYSWSSISLGRIPPPGWLDSIRVGSRSPAPKWILLYQRANAADSKANPPHDAFNQHGIYARIGETPWQWSDEFEIFNPDRDGAWGTGLMNDRQQSYAYGAFLLNPYTLWDEATQTVTIYYLMSTFSPYQAVVMRSTIKLP
jgi:hypothetical protein